MVVRISKFWLTVVALGFFGCCGNPELSRDEALASANQYVDQMRQYTAFPETPRVTEGVFDTDAKSWSFTFESGECKIVIITDRCDGADVGGITPSCKQK